MSNDTQPEIRFPEFTDEWEQRKLGEVVLVMDGDRGKNYPSSGDFYEKEHTLFLSAANITKNGFSFDINQYITEEKSNSMGNGKLEANDIVLTSRGSLGHIAWYDKDIKEKVPFARINSGMLILRSNDKFEASFIAQYLKSPLGKCQIDLISFGSAQPQLTKKDVLKYKISLPNKDEKMKLGIFFTNLDKIIALHQRKLDLLKETKKGFLQKMFPKNGAKVPEIRFPGFTENWEEKKFKEVINSGIKGKAKAEMSGTKSLYLDTNYLNGGVVTYVDSPRDVENDDVLILWDGSQAGTVYYGFSGALGSTLKAYRAKESGAFLYQQLKRNQQIIYDRYRTPNIPHVVKTFTDEFMVSMPSSEEQFKIGTFFKQLDDTIALQQRKLDLLKETKKGFLQKMFV
ncbi:restriction endonuclease subunit S [Enterococcus casseliflavus]|uniref:restriction endonuclease subunit S n=1 Tax=Enterococcus casseliflavus TaxID=37734 RepID=UPI003D13C528